ncbi:MAG: hypothetical protein ACOYEO_05115 [bacterium]|jgi:hypothetical protein
MLQLAAVLWVTWLFLGRGQHRLRKLTDNRPLGARRVIDRIRDRRCLM